MAALPETLTPVVAGIHFDDILQMFELKITWQLKTPLGNFEKETRITGDTLSEIIQAILATWGAPGSDPLVLGLNFSLGNTAVLAEWLAGQTFPITHLLTVPAGSAGADGPVDPDYVYSGDWGVTAP